MPWFTGFLHEDISALHLTAHNVRNGVRTVGKRRRLFSRSSLFAAVSARSMSCVQLNNFCIGVYVCRVRVCCVVFTVLCPAFSFLSFKVIGKFLEKEQTLKSAPISG